MKEKVICKIPIGASIYDIVEILKPIIDLYGDDSTDDENLIMKHNDEDFLIIEMDKE